MCQLWGHVHAAVEEGRHGALPLQRLRALPQDERHQPAPVQTPEEAGKSRSHMWEEEAKKSRPAGDTKGVSTPICPAEVQIFKTSQIFSCLGYSKPWYCPDTQAGSGRGCRTQGDFGIFGGMATLSSSSTAPVHPLLPTGVPVTAG